MARVFAGFRERQIHFEGQPVIVQRRIDTRVYFGDQGTISRSKGKCVGAFYLINPGDASSTVEARMIKSGLRHWPWAPLCLGQEDLIPTVISVLDAALARMRRRKASKHATRLRQCAYVQLLNLSYIKNAPNAKVALKQWSQIIDHKLDRDDVPDVSADFQFVVFGWGTNYRDSRDGERVSTVLASCLPRDTSLIFPNSSTVQASGSIPMQRASSSTLDLRRQIRSKCVYPCGARRWDVRATFPDAYTRIVGPTLGDILLKRCA